MRLRECHQQGSAGTEDEVEQKRGGGELEGSWEGGE